MEHLVITSRGKVGSILGKNEVVHLLEQRSGILVELGVFQQISGMAM